MIFFAFCHHCDDERCAERRITGFVDSFVITTGSNCPLFQYGAETLAPFFFNHKKMPRLHGLMVWRTHTRTQDVLQLFTRWRGFSQAGGATAID